MASEIFKNIIEQKIDVFASTFGEGASNIFTRGNKLIHPLEYGMYKERCARELLLYTTNKRVGISDGFLISSKDNASTQCDIIMYQNDTLPIIDNGITNFFPVEIVKGIGEVKSTLSKDKFEEALLKLAKNKKMFLERKGTLKSEKTHSEEFNEIYSFLICNKLNFDLATLNFDEVYAAEPDIRMRHNLILSLQDGLFTYGVIPREYPPKQKERYIKQGGKLDIGGIEWPYAHHTEGEETYKSHVKFVRIDESDKYKHIMQFLINMRILVGHHQEYEFDLLEYVKSNIASVVERY